MFYESLHQLTADQKKHLKTDGVTSQLLCDWRQKRRFPTEAQAVIYAEIAELNRHDLADELVLLRATEKDKPRLLRAMGKLKEAFGTGYLLVAVVACVVSVASHIGDALRCIFRKARTIRVM